MEQDERPLTVRLDRAYIDAMENENWDDLNTLAALALEAAERITKLESLLAEAREVLGPLGDAGRVKLCGEWRDDQSIQKTDTAFFVTFGDLRRAATVSAKIDATDAAQENGK